jgi:hypothetical protein
LCKEAVSAGDTEEFQPILSDLREALRQHAGHLQDLVAEYPFSAVERVVPISDGRQKPARNKKGKAG